MRAAIVLGCDFTNMVTLSHASQWLQDARDANPGTDMVVMLAVNKQDLVVSQVSKLQPIPFPDQFGTKVSQIGIVQTQFAKNNTKSYNNKNKFGFIFAKLSLNYPNLTSICAELI